MLKKIINASAGTGKTYAILDTIIDIEGRGKSEKDIRRDLDKTVFLSFSNAAVEEMKDRISKKMMSFKKEAKTGLANSIMNNASSRVYTIHSFALELSRIFRYELGLPLSIEFVPVEGLSLWKEAVREYYKKEWSRPQLAAALGLSTETELACLDIFFILSDLRSVRGFLTSKGNDVFFISELENTLKKAPDKKTVDEFFKAIGSGQDREKSLYALKAQLQSLETQIDIALAEIKKLDKAARDNKTADSRAENAAKADDARQAAKAMLNPLKLAAQMLDDCGFIPEAIAKYIGNKYYMPMQYEKAVFDFDAVVFLVIAFMKSKGRKWFTERMKKEGLYFENLVIDEAQDNDMVQNYLLSILAGGETDTDVNVTVVGDMKQSIYQFRGAYSEEFRAFYEDAKTKNRAQDLQKTWRVESAETLGVLNNLFDNMAQVSENAWDYVKQRDELQENKDKAKPAKPVIKYVRLFKDKNLSTLKPMLNDFVKGKRTGILVRRRGGLTRTGLKELIDASFKYRVKMEKGETDPEKTDIKESMIPEYYMIRPLLYMQSADTVGLVPFFMHFTLPGSLLKSKTQRVKDDDTSAEGIKSAYYYACEVYRAYGSGSIARSVYRLADSFGLWSHMYHADEDGFPQSAQQNMITRSINSVLSEIYLFEKNMKGSFYTAEDIVTDIAEADYSPYEWYSLPDTKHKDGVEVTTIHSSKGLEYESVIIAADFNELLSTRENFKDSKDFSHMYAVTFGKMKDGAPKINMRYFPYFGNLTANAIRDIYECNAELFKGSLDIYNEVKRRQISERYNLVYVALTRTIKNLLLIDLSPTKEEKAEASVMQTLSGETIEQEEGLTSKTEQSGKKEVWHVQLDGVKPLMKIPDGAAIVTARDLIMQEKEITYRGNTKLTQSEKESNMVTGTTVHEMLEDALKGRLVISNIENKNAESAGKATLDTEKRAAKIMTDKANVKELQEKFASIEGYDLKPEVPVWGLKDNGTIVKGVMDGLAEKDGKWAVIEYKTVFGDETAQKQLCEEQLKVYGEFVKDIKGSEPEKISVMLREG
ncbi:MAG TPA: UvrD-helicase domain-containing protein [Candidatus Goldiibacteriota bacterium]|nr:UvrD-helicase domain-containing protein [Candidatus Goldiibacteriota bacterium]